MSEIEQYVWNLCKGVPGHSREGFREKYPWAGLRRVRENINRRLGRRGLQKLPKIKKYTTQESGGVTSEDGINFKDSINFEEDGDTAVLIVRSKTIHTVKEALEVAQIDTEKWEVVRSKVSFWPTAMKLYQHDGEKRTSDKPIVVQNCVVTVHLKTRMPNPMRVVIESLIKDAKKYSPSPPKPWNEDISGEYLLELSLFDLHLGMLAWEGDTIESYDLKKARTLYIDAVQHLLDTTGRFTVSRILLPVGNDFFHINSPEAKTPRGGFDLSMDSRYPKVLKTGIEAMRDAVDAARMVAPVDLLWVPGNHDPETSWFLMEWLNAWFNKDDRVSVDTSPRWRKGYTWGNNFIGFTHGSEEHIKELPRIFLDEFPKEWASAGNREIHIGHKHRKLEISYWTMDQVGSTGIRRLPSLCPPDHYHYRKGFVGNPRIAQAIFWHKKHGPEIVRDYRA